MTATNMSELIEKMQLIEWKKINIRFKIKFNMTNLDKCLQLNYQNRQKTEKFKEEESEFQTQIFSNVTNHFSASLFYTF